MWRRAVSLSSSFAQLQNLAPPPLSISSRCFTFNLTRLFLTSTSSPSTTPFQRSASPLAASDKTLKRNVEDFMPIATGHEREELDAELQGRNILEINYPVGPFGTKEAPAVVKSYYDKRIVGCPGGEGEEEHDVVWFWLEKGKPHDCSVCSQHFKLEVIGPGGSPDGHGDHH